MSLFTKTLIFLVLVASAIGALLFWLADPLYLKAPRDQELIAAFESKRAAFEQLREMVTDDSVSYITLSDLDALSADRKREYKILLSTINTGLTLRSDGQSVRFIFAGGGLSAIGPGWLKGIEYLPGDPGREGALVESLDHPGSLALGGVFLRQIETNWFLIFQNTD